MAKTFIVIGLLFLIFVAALILAFFHFFAFGLKGPSTEKSEVRTGNSVFRVDVADTIAKRTLGLSGRDSLGEGEGMFFVFANPGDYGFWMKDMKFPIDIIWIKGNLSSRFLPGKIWEGRVAGVSENIAPEPGKSLFGLKIYHPPEPVDGVLEVNAGAAEKNKIAAGDKISYNP